MASVNKVFLLGNLGADPEVRYTQGGSAVANLRIATTDVYTDKGGERQERTEWHRVVAWGKTAELCKEYLRKGRQVHVEGRLQTTKWTDKDGQNRYSTEIVADRVTFLGGRGEGGDRPDRGSDRGSDRPSGRRESQQGGFDRDMPPSSPAFDDDQAPPHLNDDDIPF